MASDDDCSGSGPHQILNGFHWTSVVTITFVLGMYLCYLLFPITRGQTSELVMWRSVADLIMGANLIVAELVLGNETCVSAEDCKWFSLVHQFSIMASGCWFMTMSLELLRAVRNPFSRHAAHPIRNHTIVWGTSAFFTVMLWVSDGYGISSLELCWIKYEENTWNARGWSLFYLPTIIIYFLSICVLVFVARSFSGVSARSHHTRRRVLRQGTAYVIGFCIYWTALGVLYAADYGAKDFESDSLRVQAIVCMLGLRGMWDMVIWLKVNQLPEALWSKGWGYARGKGVPMDDDGEPLHRVSSADRDDGYEEVMLALRRDLMLFTATGIHDNAIFFEGEAGEGAEEEDITEEDYVQAVRDLNITHDQPLEADEHVLTRRTSGLSHTSEYRMDIYDKIVALGDRLLGTNHRDRAGKFEDYAPHVFREIRRLSGLDCERYASGFVSCGDVTARMTERFSEGKSGMFLYFTEDKQFMVKQMERQDFDTVCSILPQYLAHLRHNPRSLIMRVYGCHAIELPFGSKIYFGVFQNIFAPPGAPAHMLERYDLKGSTVARRVLSPEFSGSEPSPHAPEFKQCLKDQDWLRLGRGLHLEPAVRLELVSQVKRDCDFFLSVGVMDYSMLLGIAEHDGREYKGDGVQHVYVSEGRVYSFGIIDILQRYDCGKFSENCAKRYLRCQGQGISCRPPQAYAQRFADFCQIHVFGHKRNTERSSAPAASAPTLDAKPDSPSSVGRLTGKHRSKSHEPTSRDHTAEPQPSGLTLDTLASASTALLPDGGKR